jgi:hypothetical protein
MYDDVERDIHADIAARNKGYSEKVAIVGQITVADVDDTSTPLDPVVIDISSDSDQGNNILASQYAQRGSTRRHAKGIKDRAPDSNQTSRAKVCVSSSVVSRPSLSRLT